MPNATDAQMQAFADQRIRVRAEQFRLLLANIRDDAANITDEYARATSNSAWADNRTDGPPHLLQAGNSANPDDVLNYNAMAVALISIIDGVGSDATNAAALRSNWGVFQRACVRPLT
jgi:hypothetical protein